MKTIYETIAKLVMGQLVKNHLTDEELLIPRKKIVLIAIATKTLFILALLFFRIIFCVVWVVIVDFLFVKIYLPNPLLRLGLTLYL